MRLSTTGSGRYIYSWRKNVRSVKPCSLLHADYPVVSLLVPPFSSPLLGHDILCLALDLLAQSRNGGTIQQTIFLVDHLHLDIADIAVVGPDEVLLEVEPGLVLLILESHPHLTPNEITQAVKVVYPGLRVLPHAKEELEHQAVESGEVEHKRLEMGSAALSRLRDLVVVVQSFDTLCAGSSDGTSSVSWASKLLEHDTVEAVFVSCIVMLNGLAQTRFKPTKHSRPSSPTERNSSVSDKGSVAST